ncbi:transcriptional regulator [Burkholderia vietnamiensis]|uniref:transcriptional regulator n=1 Tax=Burkholderia vietnamiensis TaxID=60552 RepID=UPI001BA0EFD6|nr:YdaS family helix-turn-helix protein [Burkholderia vietnamiensis]MBR8147049.1 helix-turn-helix domain-containing protein [Burkholderia vietnamiensis]
MDTLNQTPNPNVAEALDLLGGDSAVARLLNVRPWAISKWRRSIPPGRVLWLAEQTGWRKTPHQLCPEIYPNERDGMPLSLQLSQVPA